MKIVFFGDFSNYSAAHLHHCLAAGHEVLRFVCTTKSLRRRRRKERLTALLAPQWSVDAQLRRKSVPLIGAAVPLADSGLARQLAPLGAELLVSAGFPARIPAGVTALFPHGAINAHPALLPNYRGAYPGTAMLLDGTEAEFSGVTIHAISDAYDEGPILARERLAGVGEMRLGDLDPATSRLGGTLLVRTLADLPRLLAGAQPQPPGPYRTAWIRLRDLTIDTTAGDAAFRKLMRLSETGTYPRFRLGEMLLPVMQPSRRLGPPTSGAPKLRPLSVEFDTAESRIRVRRARKQIRQLHELQRILRLRSAPP